MQYAFFDPIINPAAVTYMILNGPGSPNLDLARTALNRMMNGAVPIVGEPTAGHIHDIEKALSVLEARPRALNAPERLAYLAYFGGRAIHLLALVATNALPAVDYNLRSGDIEGEARALAGCLDEVIEDWSYGEHTAQENNLRRAAGVWSTQLRRLCRAAEALPDEGADPLMRRLRETYDDAVILAPISDGWAVCEWPQGQGVTMRTISSGDTPAAAAMDALTRAL